MARGKARRRRAAATSTPTAFAAWVKSRWVRVRLWLGRHARDNVVLAVLATIGAFVSRPFKRSRKDSDDNVIFGALTVLVFVVLLVAFVSDRAGSGSQLARAAEPPTTAETTATIEADRAPAPPPDTGPPPLLLDPSLTDGLEVGTNHIVVSGVTDPNAKVVIAGIELTADGDGAFAADVPLGLGSNLIEVVATDEAGNATGAAFHVVYVVDAPPPPPNRAPKRVVTTTSTVSPPATTRATTTTPEKGTTATGDRTTTTLASTTTRSTTTTSTPAGGISFPTVPTTTQATATTQAPTTTQATTTEATTTTTEATTTTTPDTTPTTTPDTTPSDVDDTTTTTECLLDLQLVCL